MAIQIQHEQRSHDGAFYAINQGQQQGELTYQWQGDTTISIDHTWVDPALRGQGVARQLLDAAVAFAREKGIKILPRCSYAVAVFKRDTSLADVHA